MDPIVFAAVLLAAALHATWNALVKGSGDKLVSMTAVVLGHAPFGVAALAVTPMPAAESWPYIAVGAGLHFGYQMFLMASYRIGDLTQVYPIARGSAPMIVAAVSAGALGVSLSSTELAAVAFIGLGIMSLVFVRSGAGMQNTRAAVTALVTGCFIAGYSLVDGLGAREAGTAVGFYGWLTLINALALSVFVLVRRPGVFVELAVRNKSLFFVGGGLSYAAYAIVIWAFTQAPIALVTALRETSIVFALFIGVFFLKEGLNLIKVVSTMITLGGVALLRLSR